MKNKIIYTLLLPLSTALSTAAMAELSKEDLAQEVAHCYVGHERAQTDIYTSGKAEELKPIISNLVGKADVNKTILIAKRIQMNSTSNGVGMFTRADKVVKKYCSSLDEKMTETLK